MDQSYCTCFLVISVRVLSMASNSAGKADSRAATGAIPKASSRPGTAKTRPGTIRPGAGSAAMAATTLAANEGVCLQVSNKKDERARKVGHAHLSNLKTSRACPSWFDLQFHFLILHNPYQLTAQ